MKHFRGAIICVALLALAATTFAQLAPFQLQVIKMNKQVINPRASYSAYDNTLIRTTDDVLTFYTIELSRAMIPLNDVHVRWAILVQQQGPWRVRLIKGESVCNVPIGGTIRLQTQPVRTGVVIHSKNTGYYDYSGGSDSTSSHPIARIKGYEVEVYVNGQRVIADMEPPEVEQEIEAAKPKTPTKTGKVTAAPEPTTMGKGPSSSFPPPPPTSLAGPTTAAMTALADRIGNGDQGAFDTLRNTAAELYRGIGYEKDKERVMSNLTLMRAAFNVLGGQAAQGNDRAFQALKICLRTDHLRSFAPDALGIAAAAGHQGALDILVNHDAWGILKSSAVFALQAAAEANEERAVDFLVAVILNPADRPLWSGASEGLKGAAAKGNQKAQDALAQYAEANRSAP